MFSLEASATFPHDPAAVFAVLASIEAAVRWQVGVLGVRRIRAAAAGDQPRPVTLRVDYHALGVRHPLRARVTACDPPTRFAYRLENPALALDIAFGLAPTVGGTAFSYQLRLTTHRPDDPGVDVADLDQRIAAFRRLLARRAPRDLARLEHYLARRLRVWPPVSLVDHGAGARDARALAERLRVGR